jgi:hypothetical protein
MLPLQHIDFVESYKEDPQHLPNDVVLDIIVPEQHDSTLGSKA